MRITVLYFARVRDITGTAQETFDISWGSMDELMEKVFSKYPELRNISNLLISVNNEYYSGIPLRENELVGPGLSISRNPIGEESLRIRRQYSQCRFQDFACPIPSCRDISAYADSCSDNRPG
ncbi:MAG: hypothetical protein QXS49_03945 [Ferroplasma sp.]